MNKSVELLSPVGSMSGFYAACNSKADAIYMGLENFNARMMAENFSKEEYIDCILKAHILNIKVYLTLNVLLFDNEIKEALNLISELYSYGIDGVIVQDIGLAILVHKALPDLDLHASTQMSVYSLEQVEFLKSIGFKRVVLARELTIDEIKYIRENTDVELEVFVHGALCVSYSGQCLLSALIGSRSANRGSCAQPCRKQYSLISSKGKELVANKYLLSKKDICGIDYISKLVEIGIDSLKIEGRGKTPEYIFITTSKYRKYLDNLGENVEAQDKKELMQVFNRSGLSAGYLDGIKHEEGISYNSSKNTGIYLGQVIDERKEYIKIKLDDDIDMHDGIEVYEKDLSPSVSTIVTCIKDDKFNNVNTKQKKGSFVWLGDVSKSIKYGSKVYKTSSKELNSFASKNSLNINDDIKRNVNIDVCFKLNKKPIYKVNILGKKILVEADTIAEKSISKSLTVDDIITNLSKNKETLFKFNVENVDIDENLYISVSALNKLRNKLVMRLNEAFVINRVCPNIDDVLSKYLSSKPSIKNTKYNALYLYDYKDDTDYISLYKNKFNSQNLNRLYINIALGYNNIEKIKNIIAKYKDIDIYLYIPNVVGKKQSNYIYENIENFIKFGIKGFVLGSYTYIDLLIKLKQKYNIKLVADYTLNVTNKYSATFLNILGFDSICVCLDALIDNIDDICKVSNIELLCDKVTAITSRYCIISSFLRDKKINRCSMPCVNGKYKLKDERNYTYDIYTDNIDCIMRLVRNIKNSSLIDTDISLRRVI